MAFITHPLPSPKSRPFQSSVRTIPTSALSPGVISVSRRRRVYEFLRATSTSINYTENTSISSSSSSSSTSTPPSYPSFITSSSDVWAIRAAVLERAKQHEQAIRDDAVTKAQQWHEEISALRQISVTPSSIPAQIIDSQSPLTTAIVPAPISSIVHQKEDTKIDSAVDSSSPVKEKPVEKSQQVSSRSQTSAVKTATEEKLESSQKSQPTTVKKTPEFDLYSPPSPRKEEVSSASSADKSSSGNPGIVETAVKTMKEVVDKVASSVESITEKEESVKETGLEPVLADAALSAVKGVKDTVNKVSSTVEKVVKPESEKQNDSHPRSIGETILDAIVEGVPSPQKEEASQVVDKSDLIELVDSGKVKNLTVTKLRRLLSANNLKTSGRKSELIARLTSYAKAK